MSWQNGPKTLKFNFLSSLLSLCFILLMFFHLTVWENFKSKNPQNLESEKAHGETDFELDLPNSIWFKMEHCGCERNIRSISDEAVNFEKTTCGMEAYLRGMGQKIISFSFYGSMETELETQRQYFKGAKLGLFYPTSKMYAKDLHHSYVALFFA